MIEDIIITQYEYIISHVILQSIYIINETTAFEWTKENNKGKKN